MKKKCRVCEAELPLEFFHFNKRYDDGRDSRCKDCAKLYKLRLNTPKARKNRLEAIMRDIKPTDY